MHRSMPFPPLSAPWRRPVRDTLLGQMLRFGVVGGIGFLVDTLTLYAALALGAGLYFGRVVSYIVAATGNWALNRVWTFRAAPRAPLGRQWLLFLAVNLVGFAINYGTYAALVSYLQVAAAHPVLGVAAGAIAGMGVNFLLSRSFVFRPSVENLEKVCD